MPVISVIVPIYKVENYLENCIKSIIGQTFTDIEIILVDDGSPDRCGEICDEYEKSDSRIKVVHRKNGGLSSARNAGLDIAEGEFVCFVDSDDYISPDYCEVLYNLLKDTNYDFSVCGVKRFNDGDTPAVDESDNSCYTLDNICFLSAQVNKKSEFGVWNKLYRKEKIKELRFAEGKLNEDVIWSADLALKFINGVVISNKQCYFYRQRNSGIVSSQSEKASVDLINAKAYLIDASKRLDAGLFEDALRYGISYSWSFVDKIYCKKEIKENLEFLKALQSLIRTYSVEYKKHKDFSKIMLHRMILFSKSINLYRVNVFGRIFRNYICRLFKIDPYKSEHSI